MKTRMDVVGAKGIAAVLAGALAMSSVTPMAYAQKGAKPKTAATTATPAGDAPLSKDQLASAKKHYGDGDTKFKAGDYAGALMDFQAADAIKATPQSARYIGLCQDNLGHFPEAIVAYDRFLANVPTKMAVQGDEIRAREAAIKQMPGKVHVASDPAGATVALDGKPEPGMTPTDIDVAAGHHTLHFTAIGHDPADKDIDVVFASRQDVMVTLPTSVAPVVPVAVATPAPTPTPAPVDAAPPPAPTQHSLLPAYITGGLAIAAAGVGTAFGILALNDKSKFDKNPTESTADDGENRALIADMAFGVALTLGVTSAVLFLTHEDAPPPAAAASTGGANGGGEAREKRLADANKITITPTPIVTMHGGGAGALIRF